jgi:tetratricopeptide (TPR) repeat protein
VGVLKAGMPSGAGARNGVLLPKCGRLQGGRIRHLTPAGALLTRRCECERLAGARIMNRRNRRRVVPRLWPAGVLALVCLPTLLASAQISGSTQRSDPFNGMGATTISVRGNEGRGGGTFLQVRVYAENLKTLLDRQSVLKLTNQTTQTVIWQTTSEVSDAAIELPFGKYSVEVSAVGYVSEQREVQVLGSFNTIPLEVVLHRDPAAIEFNVTEAALPPKARKETKHGVSALKSGNLKDARRRLDTAYKLAPSNPDLNFLMGYLSYQQKEFGQAQTYLGNAAHLNPHNVQALTLLGRLGLMQEDYGAATSTLEKAVAADSEYWMAHNLLADAYLKQRKYDEARQQAELAIAKGKSGASTANLALGQALVNLGQKEQGLQALKTFVQDSPKNPTTPQVRVLIAEIEGREPGVSGAAEIGSTNSGPVMGVDPLLASPELSISVKPWQPPGIDEVKPSVAAGVSCPDSVMEMSGLRAKQLVADVSRIAAIEHLMHQRVDEMGNPATRESRDYNYVASISEDKPGFLQFDEYRAEHMGVSDFPDQIASSGFAALALVFHPSMRDNFEMVCEGLGDWHGQATWLVHFKQRDDKPARIHDYKVGADTYSVKLKGRAWITSDKFQIVRIESELVSPMPQIRLQSEHQIVEYGPVPFGKKKEELWLPQSAEIYFGFRKHRYYRRHSFDHYMLFSVDSDEKRKEPKAPPADPTAAPPA